MACTGDAGGGFGRCGGGGVMVSRFFIDRPIFAVVLSLFIVLAGSVSVGVLPVEQYPQITPPTVSVTASFPGANAKSVAESVASVIEQQVNGVDDMLYMTSTSTSNGSYQLTVTFEVGTDLDQASVQVQNRVAAVQSKLPQEVRNIGVEVRKRSTSVLMLLAVTSSDPAHDSLFLTNYLTLRVRDELGRLAGVGEVSVLGGSEYAMRIWLDPRRLSARGLSVQEVLSAVREQNVQVAAGAIGAPPAVPGQSFVYTVNVEGRLSSEEQFGEIIVKSGEGGRLTRLRDVARVELAQADYSASALFDGRETGLLLIYQKPGANALEVASAVRARMAELSGQFPAGLEVHYPLDTTKFVVAAVDEVLETLLIAVVLVFLTIFVFLQEWRITMIPALTIPVSLIGTLAVMAAAGYSVNMLTLFGIVLAIGIVVDDAIVVVENAARNMAEGGLSAREATARAMDEVSGPVIATTLVLLAVFVPTAMLGGITGQLYRQFALTISVATVFSSINALTLSPALAALILRKSEGRGRLPARAFNWCFDRLTGGYRRVVRVSAGFAVGVLVLYAGLMGVSGWGFSQLPTGFVPQEDQGYMMVAVQLPDAASLERTEEVLGRIRGAIESIPGIDQVTTVAGYSLLDSSASTNSATCWVTFLPWDERAEPQMSPRAIVGEIMARVAPIHDALVIPILPPPIMGLGSGSGFELQLQDRGQAGLTALQETAAELVGAAAGQAALSNVYTVFRAGVPQLQIELDRVMVKSMGLGLDAVWSTLQSNLGSTYINDFVLFGRNYRVMAQAEPMFRSAVEDVSALRMRNRDGGMVPLGAVATVNRSFGPTVIKRHNLYPTATISAEAAAGFGTGEARGVLAKVVQSGLPDTMGYEWTGTAYQEERASGQAMLIFALAIVCAYLVLCAQYESWWFPLAVMLSVPLSLAGVVAGLMLTGLSNNTYTQIGIVLLIAMAAKNAILIVEFARQLQDGGKARLDAVVEASVLRFRPIVMTSLAFVLGTFPLVVASGAGAASRVSVGVAIFGGMISATVLTVIFAPAFYVLTDRVRAMLMGHRHGLKDGRVEG